MLLRVSRPWTALLISRHSYVHTYIYLNSIKTFFVSETPFYVSLHVSNKSPGETIFFPVKESLDSGFHLNPGTAMNIQETVENEKPLTYVALRSDDHKVLLMNNQTRLVITPAKTKTWNTQVDITTPTSMKLFSE